MIKTFIQVVNEMTRSEKRDLVIFFNHNILSLMISRGWDIKRKDEKPLFTNPFIYFDTDYISKVLMNYVVKYKLKIDKFDDFDIFNIEETDELIKEYFKAQNYVINDPYGFLTISDISIIPHRKGGILYGIYILFFTKSEIKV